MLNKEEIKYCYDDVSIVPTVFSKIRHRNECDTFDEFGYYPIFTAPMSSVVDENNFDIFEENKIHAIIPRNVNIDYRIKMSNNGHWAAYSMEEFRKFFTNAEFLPDFEKSENIYALIDVANGHMADVYHLARFSKQLYRDKIKIMIGNIANPETYINAAREGIDYVRVGIGGGSCCTTTTNTGIHYPQASLIDEVFKLKIALMKDNKFTPKIIADGGIKSYADINKALALGADYVMIGSMFGSLLESAGDIIVDNDMVIKKNQIKSAESKNDYVLFKLNDGKEFLCNKNEANKVVYGMASDKGQIALNGSVSKTSEGVTKKIKLYGNINEWTKNMDSYMKSAMSYLGIKTIKDFPKANVILISNNTKNNIN